MSSGPTGDDLINELLLTPEEILTLHALQMQLMQYDVRRERRDKTRVRKQARTDDFHSAFVRNFDGELSGDQLEELRDPDVAINRARTARKRSRALIILIELMTFNPWAAGETWGRVARQESLSSTADVLEGLGNDDFNTATAELEALLRQLRRRSIHWGRVAIVSAVGLGAGALTAGWAAPVVGGLIGGTLGLTGAAATSAGLAMLGGGSLAAGGFGVAGGTILLTGLGGFVAAGFAGAGTLFSPVGTAAVIADAVKLDLLAKMVLNDAEDRDQKMRRVAESLQQRINEFSDKINLMSERIATLKADMSGLEHENRRLREELARLKEDRENSERAKATMEVVLDRLPKAITSG